MASSLFVNGLELYFSFVIAFEICLRRWFMRFREEQERVTDSRYSFLQQWAPSSGTS